MRVYLGVTVGELAKMTADGGFGPAPLAVHAVTPALREWFADGDQEELEYAATMDAARSCLAKLAEAHDEPPRRVVVAADVPDRAVRQVDGRGRSGAEALESIPFHAVASVHVDDADAEDAVRAAARAWAAAEAGDEDARFTVDEVFGYELLWYARQEIPDLLRELQQ